MIDGVDISNIMNDVKTRSQSFDNNVLRRHSDARLLKTKYKVDTKNLIGEGSFSKVYLAVNSKKEKFAIKSIKLEKLDKTRLEKFELELEISLDLDHKNIVKCYEIFKSNNGWYIVNEYCNWGTFVDIIKEFKKLDKVNREIYAHIYLSQLRDAIYYLHKKGILHRDLKPANILISKSKESEEEVVKLADFGFARYFDFTPENLSGDEDMNATICGSPIYMAPELILRETYNIKADLWSFGVIMYELLYGINPYESPKNIRQLGLRMKNQQIKFPEMYSERCIDLMKRLLKVEPRERIGWDDFFDHDWFSLTLEDDNEKTNDACDGEIFYFEENKQPTIIREHVETRQPIQKITDSCVDSTFGTNSEQDDSKTESDSVNDRGDRTLSDSSMARKVLFDKFEQENELSRVTSLHEKHKPGDMDKTINVHIRGNINNVLDKEEILLSNDVGSKIVILSDSTIKPTKKLQSVSEKEEKLRNTFQLLKDKGRTGSEIARELNKSPFSSTDIGSEIRRTGSIGSVFQDLLENSLDTHFGPDVNSEDIEQKNTDKKKEQKHNTKIKNYKTYTESIGGSVMRILSDSVGYSFSYQRNYGSPS